MEKGPFVHEAGIEKLHRELVNVAAHYLVDSIKWRSRITTFCILNADYGLYKIGLSPKSVIGAILINYILVVIWCGVYRARDQIIEDVMES
jgi:hypothetical protein